MDHASRSPRLLGALIAVSGAALMLTGCVPNAAPSAGSSIAVTASDTECAVETATATSGAVTFSVHRNSCN